jgi:hypothetical protein
VVNIANIYASILPRKKVDQKFWLRTYEKNRPKLTSVQWANLGSMLWSQFSAIFDSFRQKNGVFLQNQCYVWSKFCFESKNANFLPNFSAKIFKKS